MNLLPGGALTSRSFRCVPVAQGALAVTGLTVPGFGGTAPSLPTFSVAPPQMPPAAMLAPTLVSPVGNPTLSSLSPTLQWAGGAATLWQVNVRNLTTNALTPSAPLPPGQTTYVVPVGVLVAGTSYRWDVTACPEAACDNPATYRVSLDGYFTTAAAQVATSPDLQIESATVNTPSVVSGGPVYVGFNIYNRGNATARASTVSIRINQSTSSEAGVEVARASVAALEPQQGFNFSATPFVAPTVPGLYQVWMIADMDQVSGQSSVATANDAVRASTLLSVGAAAVTPTVSTAACSSPVVGQSLVCTIGGANLPASTAMNATNCAPAQMSIIAGGAATQRQFTCVPQAAGAISVTYTVPGSTGALPTLTPLNATLPASPDLMVSNLTFSPVTVAAGGTTQVYLSVVNSGSASAAASTAVVRINQSTSTSAGIDAGSFIVPALLPGAGIQLPAANVTVPTVPGTYQVWVVLDNGNAAGQDSVGKANDAARSSATLTLSTPAPDLIVLNQALITTTVVPNGDVQLRFSVFNLGPDPAAASTAVIRILPSTTSSVGPDLRSLSVGPLYTGLSAGPTSGVVVTAPDSAGSYGVWVIIDAGNTAGQSMGAKANDTVLVGILTVQ